MKNNVLLVISIIAALALTACGTPDEPQSPVHPHDAFFANLSTLCDAHFTGGSTFPDNEDHPLVGTELRNHVSHCDDSMIRIELIRDGDYWHGAWVIERRDEGLHLFHDHMGEVRTMADLQASGDSHGYGGYATAEGTELKQFFAADDATADMIPDASTNVWMMEMNLQTGTFIYYLERHDQPRFRAVMQLVEAS